MAEAQRKWLEEQLNLPAVTSSALNNSSGGWFNEVYRNRIGMPFTNDNIGMIIFDWEKSDHEISLQVLDVKGKLVISHRTTLSSIQPKG